MTSETNKGEELEYISFLIDAYSLMADELQRLSKSYREKAAELGYKRVLLKRDEDEKSKVMKPVQQPGSNDNKQDYKIVYGTNSNDF